MTPRALVIGGGPAGLMAAETLAREGHPPLLAEAMPTLGRKFLMAGKSGLNLTKEADDGEFERAYGAGAGPVPGIVREFDQRALRRWATDLGVETFVGSTGRAFPNAMKTSPLLRRWIRRLEGMGVDFRTRWRWTGTHGGFDFDTPNGVATVEPEVAILALGGASWRRLGSDGAWVPWLRAADVPVKDFAPANAGLDIAWSAHMDRVMGLPIKGAALLAGAEVHRGEFVISHRGLEGGGIYAASRAVREGADLHIDLVPDWPADKVAERIASARGSVGNRLRKGARLGPAAQALVMEFGRPLPQGAALATLLKRLPVRHRGLRPLDEAISSAGGIAWEAVSGDLELRAMPGTFVAGEMLDWEAPTGGYLLSACFATGRHAGLAAARRLGSAEKRISNPRADR
ncbi:TIGR03862 family flavoprotein [Palleronia sp. LCG004]|uniref:TIGR03862 family flavoprotein n=1 Tax=Palleronia sp. LCG004 TaxID=3079304 RepID=UPI002943E87D|nr:TIGR03862 family flavoprotein [Palleronia sp. LCG004]WOI56053.1 TIGR03862 family flavoprotein [Palleronia sp. LCG004]